MITGDILLYLLKNLPSDLRLDLESSVYVSGSSELIGCNYKLVYKGISNVELYESRGHWWNYLGSIDVLRYMS